MNGKNIKKNEPQDEMVFSWANYKWRLIGVGIVSLGFVLMAGGGSDDPNIFSAEEIFSWRRISLAPFVVLAGFGVVGYSIFHRKRNEK